LADLYYREEDFEKARKTYQILVELCATNKELDEFEITLRFAVSALRTKKMKEAYKSLVIARSLNQEGFEVNYNLGYLEFLRKNYEKSAPLLAQAREYQPEHPETLKYLGLSRFKLNEFDDAVSNLKLSVDLNPDDKETMFALGQCYYEQGEQDRAVQILTHLRADPEIGSAAALYAGTIHLKMRQYDEAVSDFEIGLKHEGIKEDVLLELKYRLAAAYIEKKNVPEAIRLYKEIEKINPNFKDVAAQNAKYQELSLNRNLQTFLLGSVSEFVALCRKLCETFYPDGDVKVIDISVQKSESADLLAEVHTARWEDLVLFRYVRTSSQTGDLTLREMYARMKELKAGRGFCISAGGFTETAQSFVEARLIDLVEKDTLVRKLNTLAASSDA
ncbi:MAG: tetratricopeptide repeat protein, partial [Spirochaetales bacterium]|nr:tetratricopeptide repeat protein [Spirochaetales bacterium]